MMQIYLIKGALATTAIEGNTLSEEEVRDYLEGRLTLPASREYLGREIDNVLSAYNLIKDEIDQGVVPELTSQRIKRFDQMVLDKLEVGDHVIPGEIRSWSAVAGLYKCAPAEDCQYLLDQFCRWLESDAFEAHEPDLQFAFEVLKAVLAHLYFVWIHPFGDGNGRTARLVEFQIMVAAGAPFISAHLLSSHYNLTRNEYYRQLDHASKSGGDVVPFILYALEGFRDGIKEQENRIWNEQWRAAYRDLVNSHFEGINSNAADRQRCLLLELADYGEAVPKKELCNLSARLFAAYQNTTQKTLTRDLHRLLEEGLLIETDEGLSANLAILQPFSQSTPRSPGRLLE